MNSTNEEFEKYLNVTCDTNVMLGFHPISKDTMSKKIIRQIWHVKYVELIVRYRTIGNRMQSQILTCIFLAAAFY